MMNVAFFLLLLEPTKTNSTMCKCIWQNSLGILILSFSTLHLTGHIGIAVPDVNAACKLFEEQGVTFVKKPDDGKM